MSKSSLMPYRVIMARASLVACSMSLEAPVETEPNTTSSAARPPVKVAILFSISSLAHQVVVALLHLHGVAQGAGGAGDDGDLLHRGGVGLLGRHQGVADLVVGHDPLLLVGEDGVLLLVAGDDHLDALLQVGLGGEAAARPAPPAGPPR